MKIVFAAMFASLLFVSPAKAQVNLCVDICTDCALTATDALAVLNCAVGNCPPVDCGSTTTTLAPTTTLGPTTTMAPTTTSSTTTTTVQSLGCNSAQVPECASDTCLEGWSCLFNGIDTCKCIENTTTTTSTTTQPPVQSLGCNRAEVPECASDTCLEGWSCLFNGNNSCKCVENTTTTTTTLGLPQ